MKKTIYALVMCTCIFLISSCSSDSDDDLIDDNSNIDVTYTGTVKAIIDGKCLGCHSNPTRNNAPMPLTTYTNVKDAVQNLGLIGQVESGNMPLTGTNLTASQVQAIKNWQTGGFLE